MELNDLHVFQDFIVTSATTPDGIDSVLFCRACHKPIETKGDTLEDYTSEALLHVRHGGHNV